MPLVGWIISALVWTFKSRIGLFIMSGLVWMGLNYGTMHMVLEPTITLLNGYVDNVQTGGGSSVLGQTMWAWMGVLEFDRAVSMIVSAFVTKQAIMSARLAWFRRSAPA